MKFDNRFLYYITTIIFILTFASIGTPYNSTRAHNTIYLYSTIGIFVSGLLFFIGGKKDVRDTINPGFGIGIPSWIASFVACSMGMNYNHYKLLQVDLFINLAIISIIEDPSRLFIIFIVPQPRKGLFIHTVGYYGALAQALLTLSILILGVLAFIVTNVNYWMLTREQVIVEFCPYCGLNLGGRYSVTFCPNCGRSIR